MTKVIKTKWHILCVLAMVLIMAMTIGGCHFIPISDGGSKKGVASIIGVSQANMREEWRVALINELREETAKYEDIRIVTTDATGSAAKQIQDIDNLIGFGMDLLIISPCDEKMMGDKIKEVYDSGIPVIVMDRAVEGFDYTLYIGPDNEVIGQQAGSYIIDLLGEKGGDVVVLQGNPASVQGTERLSGFKSAIEKASGINLHEVYMGAESKDAAYDMVITARKIVEEADIIFTYSDNMALGACDALRELGLESKVMIVDCDGFKGADEGIDLVSQGRLKATVSCPIGGKEAIDYALSILNNESGVPKQVILRSNIIDKGNVEENLNRINADTVDDGRKIKVGYSQVGQESNWRLANTKSIEESAKDFNIELHMEIADQSQEKQFEAIRSFIKEGVDVIVVSPVVETGWDEVLREAKAAGIPVIMSDRNVLVENREENLTTTYLGADFVEEGRRAMRWVRDNVDAGDGDKHIMEIMGNVGASPTEERDRGFREILAENPGYDITYSAYGDFTFDGGRKVVREYLENNEWDIDIIFSQNDDMALGAIEELKAHGIKPDDDVKIISVDATTEAFEAMVRGELSCAVECNPIIGPQLMKAIRDLCSGKQMPFRIITDEKVYDQSVAEDYIRKRLY
ncbi:substrate-binding domain-containing protein [Butyrivibrio sp. XPD2006]|uniref:substrate-binding domain-containing protein n=1 Tax=Butyrivibrio sp. XPD2006 TaxID=1280668 RepID=UPI0003B71523|nr:substrate-binding domain-containing protein [Butyrivibrio sp. XPD2006]